MQWIENDGYGVRVENHTKKLQYYNEEHNKHIFIIAINSVGEMIGEK